MYTINPMKHSEMITKQVRKKNCPQACYERSGLQAIMSALFHKNCLHETEHDGKFLFLSQIENNSSSRANNSFLTSLIDIFFFANK